MAEITMPTLGADMTQGRLLEWLVKPGDTVARGDIVAVVDTDKAEIEIESFHDGVVQELVVGEGERVPVGTTIARVGDGVLSRAPAAASEEPESDLSSPQRADTGLEPDRSPELRPEREPEPPHAAAAPIAPKGPRPAHRLRVTPLARRIAADLGIDVATLQGTGPAGAVVRADVEAHAAHTPAAPVPAASVPTAPAAAAPPGRAAAPQSERRAERQAAMRRAIAELMSRSKREVPHYYLEQAIDLSRALGWLDDLNAERPPAQRILPAALLLRATAVAAGDAPGLNGHWVDGALQSSDRVHLGVAIALRGGGVVAPAIRDADRLALDDLMAALRDLVARVRAGRLRAGEMTDATMTVTQLGDRGADLVHGVVFVPQVALVGLGRIAERPWAQDAMVGARPTVTATLAADHRASDGHAGSLLLGAIAHRLTAVEELL